jgi:hypothetical protein
MRVGITLLFASLFLGACNQSSGRTTSTSGSTGGRYVDMSTPIGGDECGDAAKLVYVVDESNQFSSFDPSTLTFTNLGTLDCPDTVGDNPFSMAVDRNAQAWVLFSSDRIFQVDIVNNLACKPTNFVSGQHGFDEFGMGFAANAVNSTDETLYIAGGSAIDIGNGSSQFGSIAFPSLAVSQLGNVDGWPELTGTGDAKLWGFFPDTSPPKVAQIDKTTGASGTIFPAPALASSGTPQAWAFAFWGGDFWIFLERDVDTSTTVYQVKQSDGSVTAVKRNTGRKIVGAGVSTCAPVTVG